MYLVIAKVTAQPEKRAEMHALLVEMAGASRAEPGCLSYRFTSDVEDEDTFASIEVWDDRAALDVHLASPGLAAMLTRLGPLVAGAPTITGYDVPAKPDVIA